jgi:hypothetical protein
MLFYNSTKCKCSIDFCCCRLPVYISDAMGHATGCHGLYLCNALVAYARFRFLVFLRWASFFCLRAKPPSDGDDFSFEANPISTSEIGCGADSCFYISSWTTVPALIARRLESMDTIPVCDPPSFNTNESIRASLLSVLPPSLTSTNSLSSIHTYPLLS